MKKNNELTNNERGAIMTILKYIEEQPKAKHTSEGIAKIWIFKQRLEEQIKVVEKGIQYLVNEGFLVQVLKEDDEYYYKANKTKINEIPNKIQKIKLDL